ncbi:MAG: histidine--tRNA ligase [Candidatus Promineifilaceae bacterium]|nr:histidine--tRNA ligase [Candidatus Promineifilaceae bacterium]
MAAIQSVTGMQDVLPETRRYWDLIESKAAELARRYGFVRLDPPVIEYTELFARGVGTASDFFVKKEMYTISEEDGLDITLRPEFTAGFVRAYIENGLHNWPQPVKLYSIGPLFRRERPQAGRFRQHSQFNLEILGEIDPAADLEIMMLAMNLHRELGYKALTFQLNSTGCPVCKPDYVEELVSFLQDHSDELSDIDRERMRRNPLRVLDSKELHMDKLLAEAPHIVDYLCEDCADHFAELRALLDELDQPYTINYRLVRGIDYYTKTVFELWDQNIGAQAALCGGGRYDGLAEAIGGPSTPGVGVGIGIERIVIGLQEQDIEPPPREQPAVMVAHFGGVTKRAAVETVFQLRQHRVGARLAFARERRSMKSQMREADKHEVKFTIIIGERELAEDAVTVRQMVTGEQTLVSRSELPSWLLARQAPGSE